MRSASAVAGTFPYCPPRGAEPAPHARPSRSTSYAAILRQSTNKICCKYNDKEYILCHAFPLPKSRFVRKGAGVKRRYRPCTRRLRRAPPARSVKRRRRHACFFLPEGLSARPESPSRPFPLCPAAVPWAPFSCTAQCPARGAEHCGARISVERRRIAENPRVFFRPGFIRLFADA